MKKTGTIQALNVSPKGFYEGFLLKTGKKVVQINLPKEDKEAGAGLVLGEACTVEVKPEDPHGEAAHVVFRMVRPVHDDDSGSKRSRPFEGRVEKLNYALHGEVNGGILDCGDFLHLKPEGARALKLKLGMQVEGTGHTRPMVGGGVVIEADVVNGIEIRHHHKDKAKKKHAGHH